MMPLFLDPQVVLTAWEQAGGTVLLDADYPCIVPDDIDLDLTEIEAGLRAAQPTASHASDFLLGAPSFFDAPLFAPKGDLLQDMLRAAPPLRPYTFSLDTTLPLIKQEPSSSDGVVPTVQQNLMQAVHAALKRPAGNTLMQSPGMPTQGQAITPSSSSSQDVAMVPENSSYVTAKPSSSSSTLSGSSGSAAVVPQASATSGLAAAAQPVSSSLAKPQQPPATFPGAAGTAKPAGPAGGPAAPSMAPSGAAAATQPPRSATDPAGFVRARAECLERYRAKKARRLYTKKIRYHLRKVNADKRPRIKGRFVKKEELDEYMTMRQQHGDLGALPEDLLFGAGDFGFGESPELDLLDHMTEQTAHDLLLC